MAISSQRPSLGKTERVDGRILISLAVIVLVIVSSTALGVWWTRQQPAPDSQFVRLTLSDTTLTIPREWLRASMPQHDGPIHRIELALTLQRSEEVSVQEDHALEKALLLTITVQDKSIEPSTRVRQLYARFLSSTAWASAGDLVLRRFAAGTPYEDEDLYISPPDGQDFWARCKRQDGLEPIAEGCLSEFRIGNLDIQAKFSKSVLPQWKPLTAAIRESVADMMK